MTEWSFGNGVGNNFSNPFYPSGLECFYPWAYGFIEAVAFILIGLWLLRGVIGRPLVLGARGRREVTCYNGHGFGHLSGL